MEYSDGGRQKAIGSTASVACVDDFPLIGPREYTCGEAGVWEPAFTTSCEVPGLTPAMSPAPFFDYPSPGEWLMAVTGDA